MLAIDRDPCAKEACTSSSSSQWLAGWMHRRILPARESFSETGDTSDNIAIIAPRACQTIYISTLHV
jgi:hypothetical protein